MFQLESLIRQSPRVVDLLYRINEAVIGGQNGT